METKEFEYNGKTVGFEINDKNVMVNATQMAKVFGKNIAHFMENESTKQFVNACLNIRNSDYLKVFSQSDLYRSNQKSGTFMHRILALKFASWLNPDFEIWVYSTIDKILFGSYAEDEKNLKEIARIQTQISQKEQFLADHPIQKEIEELKKAEQKERRLLDLRKKERISNFKSMFSVEEMAGETEEVTGE